MITCEIYSEMHWGSFVKLILSVEELLRESFCGVDRASIQMVWVMYFGLSNSVANTKLREMS